MAHALRRLPPLCERVRVRNLEDEPGFRLTHDKALKRPTTRRVKRERLPGVETGRATVVAEALPDVLQFMRLLWALVHGLDKTSKRMTSEVGVTGPQRLVLRVAGLFPGLSAGDLAALLHVHPSTLTGVLRRLVAQRLLTRVNDPRDQRRAVLNLTARGARINRAHRGTVEAAVDAALRGVTARDRAATRRVLERLTDQLGVAESPGPPRRPG